MLESQDSLAICFIKSKGQGNKKYSNESCKKKSSMTTPTLVTATILLLDKTIALEPQKEVRKAHQKTRVLGKVFSRCENTKPKTSFVEPQGTTTPNHFSSKPSARHTNNEPTKEDGCLSIFKYMLLLALLVCSQLLWHIWAKLYKAKLHECKGAFKHGNSIPKECTRHSVKESPFPNQFFRRSKPSFQPSIPNIHLTSQTQTRDKSNALLPSDLVSHHWQNAF